MASVFVLFCCLAFHVASYCCGVSTDVGSYLSLKVGAVREAKMSSKSEREVGGDFHDDLKKLLSVMLCVFCLNKNKRTKKKMSRRAVTEKWQ